jgi:putative copper resistance protein D
VSLGLWDIAAIAVKAVGYAGTLGAAGAVFFLGYSGSLVTSVDRLTIRHAVLGLAALSVLAGAAQIMISAGSMSGDPAGMFDGSLVHMVWQAGAGRAYAVRVIGLLLAALGVSSERFSRLAFFGAVAAATSFAWIGHARSLSPDVVAIMLLGIHLLGVAFWLGALAPLGIIARDNDLPRIAASAARFGAAAIFVVAGLIIAGATLLWMLLGDFTELWGSTYGRYMTCKLTFVACLLCLAAFNKVRLTPRLRAGDAGALRSLRISIRLELLLGVVILTVTAALTTLAGPPALD